MCKTAVCTSNILFVSRVMFGVLKHARSNARSPDGVIWMQNAKAPLSGGGAY